MSKSKTANVLLVLVGLCSAAIADKVDDFREATRNSGCDSIPYGDLRGTCRSQQSDVHPWCDGSRGPISCKGVQTKDLKRAVASTQVELDKLEEKLRDLKDRHSHAADDAERARWKSELESTEKEIDVARKKLEQVTRDVDNRKDHVVKSIHTLGKCIDYRRAVMNVFAYATDKTRGEPEAEIKPLAQTLRDMWSAEISGHEIQIGNKENALELCKSELP